MRIHGLRIYPQIVKVVRGERAPIFLHDKISDDCSDFFYIFHPLASSWHGHFFAKDFGVRYHVDGKLEDPMPHLRRRFGPGLIDAELDGQLMRLRGDEFASWGPELHSYEAAFLPIFRTLPRFDLLARLYWDRDFRLNSETWPSTMRAVLHQWDDIYWQVFSTNRSDLDTLIRKHAGDPKLEMFFVDIDREYPEPSNQELRPAAIPDES